MTFTIRTVSDLRSLGARAFLARRHDRLMLELPNLAEDESRIWEEKLTRHYCSCGCEAGSAVLLAALAAYLGFLALQPRGLSSAGWTEVGNGAAIGFAAAGIGKLCGLLYARLRLHATIRALEARIGR